MLTKLPMVQVYLWYAVAAIQMVLTVIVWRTGMFRKYPFFCAQVSYAAAKTLALMATPARNYFWMYYALSFANCLLIALAAVESYKWILGPKMALPGWAPRNASGIMSASVLVSIGVAAVLRPAHHAIVYSALGAVQQGLIFASAASLCVLLWYAKRLGITLDSRAARVASGYATYLSINSIGYFLTGKLGGSPAGQWIDLLAMAGYLAVIAVWCWQLWEKEPAMQRATRAMVATVAADLNRTLAVFEKYGEGVQVGRQ